MESPQNYRSSLIALYLAIILPLLCSLAAADPIFVNGVGDQVNQKLDVSRYPALYTGDFADCMAGGSLFNVTKFDTGYYQDNATISFHLDGSSNIRQESVMCK